MCRNVAESESKEAVRVVVRVDNRRHGGRRVVL